MSDKLQPAIEEAVRRGLLPYSNDRDFMQRNVVREVMAAIRSMEPGDAPPAGPTLSRELAVALTHAAQVLEKAASAERRSARAKAKRDDAATLRAFLESRLPAGDAPETEARLAIHYSDEASQPDVHLACGKWTKPLFVGDDAPEPFACTEGAYVFERLWLVTCDECRASEAYKRQGAEMHETLERVCTELDERKRAAGEWPYGGPHPNAAPDGLAAPRFNVGDEVSLVGASTQLGWVSLARVVQGRINYGVQYRAGGNSCYYDEDQLQPFAPAPPLSPAPTFHPSHATLGMRSDDPARDWTEDFTHENGGYQRRCMDCGLTFYGHKRNVVCRKCAMPADVPVDVCDKCRAGAHASCGGHDSGCACWKRSHATTEPRPAPAGTTEGARGAAGRAAAIAAERERAAGLPVAASCDACWDRRHADCYMRDLVRAPGEPTGCQCRDHMHGGNHCLICPDTARHAPMTDYDPEPCRVCGETLTSSGTCGQCERKINEPAPRFKVGDRVKRDSLRGVVVEIGAEVAVKWDGTPGHGIYPPSLTHLLSHDPPAPAPPLSPAPTADVAGRVTFGPDGTVDVHWVLLAGRCLVNVETATAGTYAVSVIGRVPGDARGKFNPSGEWTFLNGIGIADASPDVRLRVAEKLRDIERARAFVKRDNEGADDPERDTLFDLATEFEAARRDALASRPAPAGTTEALEHDDFCGDPSPDHAPSPGGRDCKYIGPPAPAPAGSAVRARHANHDGIVFIGDDEFECVNTVEANLAVRAIDAAIAKSDAAARAEERARLEAEHASALAEERARFNRHATAMAGFVGAMYGIMVDPLADSRISVDQATTELLSAATIQRDAIVAHAAEIATLRSEATRSAPLVEMGRLAVEWLGAPADKLVSRQLVLLDGYRRLFRNNAPTGANREE